MKDELLRLAEICETAVCPDWEIDDAIATALFTEKHRICIKGLSDEAGGMWMFRYPGGSIGSALRFSGSLDAALALVPDGAFWRVGHDGEGPDPSMFRADVLHTPGSGHHIARAATPSLALCAASLRALAAMEDAHD